MIIYFSGLPVLATATVENAKIITDDQCELIQGTHDVGIRRQGGWKKLITQRLMTSTLRNKFAGYARFIPGQLHCQI